jgi:predicted S18 family serine protease
MKTTCRESLIKDAENMIIKKSSIFEAFKNGNRKACTCYYLYREKVIQINELNNLYLQRKVTKAFYHFEMDILCSDARKIILRFDLSRINAINYLKRKEGLPGNTLPAKNKNLSLINKLRKI